MYAFHASNHLASASTFSFFTLSLSNFKVCDLLSIDIIDSCFASELVVWFAGSNSSSATNSKR